VRRRPGRQSSAPPILAAVACAVIGGSCLAPLPPPWRTAAASGSPAATSTAARASQPLSASVPVAGGPAASVLRRFLVNVLAVTAEGDQAWYVREDQPHGWVGHISAGANHSVEVAAGPTPVDVAVGPDALFVLEGVPDDDPRKGLPRVGVLERLDRETLRVLAQVPIQGLPKDLQLDGDRVWVGGIRGVADSFDAETLAPIGHVQVSGNGTSMVTTGDGALWLLNGIVSRHVQLVHRIDRVAAAEQSIWGVPGTGLSETFAVGRRAWVATAEDAEARLFPISLDGVVGVPLRLPRVASLVDEAGTVWWLTTAAELDRLDEATMVAAAPVDLGDVGQAVAASGDRVWAATEDLVELSAVP
jgi:hypothetical protein